MGTYSFGIVIGFIAAAVVLLFAVWVVMSYISPSIKNKFKKKEDDADVIQRRE